MMGRPRFLKPYPVPQDGTPKTVCNWKLKKGDRFRLVDNTELEVTTVNEAIVELRIDDSVRYISGLVCYFNHWANDVGLQRHEKK